METNEERYWIPQHVREYLKRMGYRLPLEDMEGHISEWDHWMRAQGSFYDYRDVDGFGRVYEVHRRSIMPAMRVCREWGSLLLDEETVISCENQACTDFLAGYFKRTGFWGKAQETVVRAFGLGTGAFALRIDVGKKEVGIRHYDAREIIPLSWDSEGVREAAFVTRAYDKGKPIDQLQIHTTEGGAIPIADGSVTVSPGIEATLPMPTYKILTVCFDAEGNEVTPAGVIPCFDTGSPVPTFALVKPAVPNTRVDMSPYGQSVFADAIDAIQAVDVAYDAMVSEVDVSKMRVFLADTMFDREGSNGKSIAIPFGRGDCTVFRKVMSTEDVIQEFAPKLRTPDQAEVFRIALQILGDACGFGLNYLDFDNVGYVKTATEVSSDNSMLMRTCRKHENALQGSLITIARALLACHRSMGEKLPDEGDVTVTFDDSIIQDTASEKAQDLKEIASGVKSVWEYRARWYGEDEQTARARAAELGTAKAQQRV